MLLYKEGVFDLLRSTTFQANFATNSTDGTGIVNLGGEVQCGTPGCLPVCTTCASTPPTPQPTAVEVLPSPPPSGGRKNPGIWSSLAFGLGLALALLMVGALRVSRRRGVCCFGRIFDGRTIDLHAEENPSSQPFLCLDDATAWSSTQPQSVELVSRSVVMKSYEFSPAAVFVIAHKTMRITLWSPGMAAAAPTLVHPLGWLLSDLPFVRESDGYLLQRALGRIFEAPDEHDETQMFALHLICQNREVLVEMVATHIVVAESDPIIVMSGREVNSDLAGLMSRKTVVAASETSADENKDGHSDGQSSVFKFRSVSQAGSSKGSDDEEVPLPTNHCDAVQKEMASSTISSLTMASALAYLYCDADQEEMARSTISSLTMASALTYPPAGLRTTPTCPPPSEALVIAADAAPSIPQVAESRGGSTVNSRPSLVGCSVGETIASHGSAARAVNSMLVLPSGANVRWAAAGHNARVRFVDDACSSSIGDSTGSAVMDQ